MVGKEIGPYKITGVLGHGGMGVVYKGIHAKLEQPVAVKVLSPELLSQQAMRERFVQEAKLQAKLSHPNVINILNYLEDENNIYLIMEYARGETLEERLRRAGPLSPQECRRVTADVLDALGFMHSQGVIHRDIKPSNIMLTEMGPVKVMDFGIAKILGTKGQTRTGMNIGTAWYMAPEQIKGGELGVATDLYALGVTMFQMLTGEFPFNGDSEFEIMRAHVETPPPVAASLNPAIPEDLSAIIARALAKNPKDRFPSAHEFKSALLGAEEGARATRHMEGLPPTMQWNGATPATVAAHSQGSILSKKLIYPLLGAAGIALALLIYLTVANMGNGSQKTPLPPPPASAPVSDAAQRPAAVPETPKPTAPTPEAARSEEKSVAAKEVATRQTTESGSVPSAASSVSPENNETKTPPDDATKETTPAVAPSPTQPASEAAPTASDSGTPSPAKDEAPTGRKLTTQPSGGPSSSAGAPEQDIATKLIGERKAEEALPPANDAAVKKSKQRKPRSKPKTSTTREDKGDSGWRIISK